VVTIADALPARHPELYPALDRRVYVWKARHAVARADLVVALSEQTGQDAVTFYGADPARVRVVGLDCDPAFGRPVAAEAGAAARRRHGLPEEYALSVGTLERRKNQGILLEALARLPGSRRPPLVLIGRATSYRAELDDAIRRLDLDRWVLVRDRVATEDLPALYQGARVFLYPSLFEGFGLPILEALRAGVPVVAGAGSALAEVGGTAARYAPPLEADAWAEALAAVLDGPALAAEMVAAGRRQAERFDSRVLAGLLIRAYGEVSS
jgi:glycosyltransferase involved in cell wall biosynthesis